ncbi:Microtubule-actin cross-linking factor 1, isoform 4 [Papilio machaon]|uniref:Microtubule-actin cross-linking factor 1, isoform 4 n=1 Tax=Papilio machaon TaxID=76193 RepID=A0A0N1IED3_PAPMA|nr:Microtubule-actin cross-linking factor 1, isoform 4 [Papilio machaon]
MEEYDYDFAYECRRLVEAMAPRSARSFRQEFNMQDVATTEHTYTTFTTEKYMRTSHSTEFDGQGTVKSMANGKLSSPNYTTKTIITEEERPDVRKLKRVHKMYEGPNIIESRGIIHPETREILTVGQAISMRILDVRTGRLLSSPETRQTMTIEQAAQEGLIDPKLAARLTGPCGMTEDGNEVTLLEAIQRELYDAEQGLSDPAEKRIKVTVDGEKSTTQGMSISDALNQGQVDLQRGLYRLPSGTYITIAEAYQRGFLIYNEIIKIKSSALSLSDAISQDLVDNNGWILDRNSGDRFQLDVAIRNELINTEFREIVDHKNDTKITLAEAIERNIINTKHSKYIHNVTKEKFSFKDAASKRYISKPMTLKDVCDNNLMTNDGKILSPANRAPLNILEAISAGVLDSDNVKCISNTTTGQLLTLSEALGARIILTDNKFRDNLTGELCTIPEAVDRGLITSVSQRSIFDIDGFKDPKTGEFVSFNTALSKGNLKYVNGETFLKSESGDFVYLEDCSKVSIIRPEVLEMFNRKIGVFENGKELSVLDAVFKNILDPKTGNLLDVTTKKPIPFNKAVEINMITPEGAALLNSLLNITLTLQTVTKTVKRYVTVTNTNTSLRSDSTITFGEAIQRGLIDENTQTFTDPTTGTVFPIQQALDEGLLGVEKNEPRVARLSDRVSKKDLVPGQVVELKITKKSFIKDLPPSPESKLENDARPETIKSPEHVRTTFQPQHGITHEIKTVTSKSTSLEPTVTSLTIKKNTIELPNGGWSLKEAIQQNLFDPSTGMFVIPGTDRVLDLEEALKLNIINPESAKVIDPKTKKELTLNKALTLHILDSTGRYKYVTEIITMKEAIERKFVILTQMTQSTSVHKVITITSMAGMPDKMEISEPGQNVDIEDQSALEPVQVIPGVIFDPATALTISTTSGISENILEAVDRGLVPTNSVKVLDPNSRQRISLKQAFTKGIIDQRTGEYKDMSGKKLTLADATKVGLIAVVGAPLVAASKVIQVVKNTMVKDPKTGEDVPMEVAYERGLVDDLTYKKYEDSLKDKSVSPTPRVDTSSDREIYERGVIDQNVQEKTQTTSMTTTTSVSQIVTTTILDPKSGETLSIQEAYDRGLIDPTTYMKYRDSFKDVSPEKAFLEQEKLMDLNKTTSATQKAMSVGAAVSEGFITVESIQNSLLADTVAKQFLPAKKVKPSADVIEIDENAVNKTPKYKIKTVKENASDTIDSKPIVLSKLRKRVISPSKALEKGLIDENTAEILDSVKLYKDKNGMPITLKTAIETGLVDQNKGKVKDPVHGYSYSIKEAIKRGILDEECQDEVLIPIAKSLSITEIMEQGLWDDTSKKIIHPETGSLLTMREAIICDIIDPLSAVQVAPGKLITLEEAIEKNVIDTDKNIVKTNRGVLDLISAVNADIFPDIKDKPLENIPLAGMTLAVAMKRGIINPAKGEMKHPLTGEIIPLDEAIEKDLLMGIPYPQTSNTIPLKDAIAKGYVDLSDYTFTNPITKEVITVDEAMAQGLLAIKLDPEIVDTTGIVTTITETFTSQHTVTTKMVELLADYVLLSANEVQNIKTGEVISIDEARKKGIVRDEQTNKEQFITSDTNISFNDAIMLGYINLEKGTFTDPKTGETITVTEAVNSGLLNTEIQSLTEPETKTKELEMLDLNEAFELLFDEKTQKFRDPKSPNKVITFKEALEQKVINPDSVIYKMGSDKSITLQEALRTGVLDSKSGKVKEPSSGRSLDVKKAAKMGLLAVVAAPVLAGMAVVQGAKAVTSKVISPKQKIEEKDNVPTMVPKSTFGKDKKDNDLVTPKEPVDDKDNFKNKSKTKIAVEVAQGDTIANKEDQIISQLKDVKPNKPLSKQIEDQPKSNETSYKGKLSPLTSSQNFLEQEVAKLNEEKIKDSYKITSLNEEKEDESNKPGLNLDEPIQQAIKAPMKQKYDKTLQSEVNKVTQDELRGTDDTKEEISNQNIAVISEEREKSIGDRTSVTFDIHEKVIKGQPTTIKELPTTADITVITKTVSTSKPTEHISEHSSTDVTTITKVTTIETSRKQSSTSTVSNIVSVSSKVHKDSLEDSNHDQVDKVIIQEITEDEDIKQLQVDAKPHTAKQDDENKESSESVKITDLVELNKCEQPLEVATGLIYDPKTKTVISLSSGLAEDIATAVDRGTISKESVKLLEPTTGKEMTLQEAIDKGIVDQKTGQLKDKSGKSINISQAAQIGLLAVVGAPVLAAAKLIDVVKNAVISDDKEDPNKIGPKSSLSLTSPSQKPESYDSDQKTKHQGDKNKVVGQEESLGIAPQLTETVENKLLGAKIVHNTPQDTKSISATFIDAEKQPLRDLDEITEQNVTKVKPEHLKVLYENIPLIDAIMEGKIEPKVCRIMINGVESPLTVQDSLEQEQISRFTPVDVISKNCVIVKESKPKYSIAISQKLTPEELSEMGVYDIEKQIFLNPETGSKLSFEELVYGFHIFDPATILVKDLGSKSDSYVPFDEAISRHIIDKTTGHMVNPKTGKRVSFWECVQIGWIVEQPEDVSVTEQTTIVTAFEKGLYNPKTGEIKDVNTGKLVPIGEAVEKCLIDHESLLIKLPRSNESITLSDAIDRGIVEIHEGIITIIETRETIEVSIAIQRGIITITRRPISIEAAIVNDMYEPISGKIKDAVTEQLVSVEDAVDRNIVHPTISEIKDTASEKFIPLSEALDSKLVDPETGKYKDKKTGKDIPLDDALRKGLISTKDVTFSLFDVIELGYYSPDTGKILNPKSGQIVTVKEAIETNLVDPSDVKIKDDKSEAVIPFKQAVTSGLLDLKEGIMTSPVSNLKDACEKGYLLSDKKPMTLQEGLVQGYYDPDTGLLTINNVTMTLEDAIKIGNINPEALTVRDSGSGEIITLSDAIKVGIIDSKAGKVRDPIQGDKISLTDASERGLIVPAKRKLSLPEAVFKGFYDAKTGKFLHPQLKDKIPTDRAIKKRMLDPQSTLVHIGGKVIPFEFAVDKGIVDGRTGSIMLGDERIDFREAFERGILVEVRKPLSLIEALEKGVYNEITGLFMDPQSGKKYTLAEAIKMNLIDPHSVHIQDNRLGKWDKITLTESMETGVIDNKTGKIRNINNENEEISLRKAFEIGLLVDSKAPISLQRALHQGLYDDSNGKFIDPATSRKITLHEAIRRSVISSKYLCYFDKKSEKPLTLADCCRSEIVDRRSGKFIEPGSDVQIPLSEAMSLGLIVDIESAGFSLYETLAMNMYNITELVFVHPVTERKITLKTAIAEELVNPEMSLVKNIPSSKYIKLTEAIQTGIIDDNNSVYILPNGNQINLLDAKHRGLIVNSKKHLSLEEIIKNGLFRADNGKIVDPSTNEFIDINKAIEINLINPELTIVKDSFTNKFKPLLAAIQHGDVDVTKGRVLDTKAKKTYSLDIAFDKGLLVTVTQPLTSQTITRRYVTDSSALNEPVLREFTLDEAIKYEFIDPKTALIKDPHKNKYIPLQLGISEGIIDTNLKGSFDTQTGRSRTLCFAFENGLIVYVREPLTFEQALENGHLNLTTARFTDPHSKEVLTVKDAATLGYIDSDTALIKDNLKKRLVKLPEAFRKGLMDAEKGNILDTETSKLNTLSAAIESGLLMTPKKSFTLIETLNFGIYNPTTGALNDPFITTSVIDRKRLTLGEAIQQGIVDPSSTVVKEPDTGKIWPLTQAIEQQLINPVEGRLITDPQKGTSIDLVKALKKGLLLPAETRQAVEEKYRLCDDTLSKLLEWIAIVEERLANQEPVKENMDELRNQINVLKLIKDDLESHQRQVSACADQAKQLLVSGGDVLAPHEVAALERGVRQLKQRFDRCTERCDKMLRRLAAARDELGKFTNELNTFESWMDGAYRSLEDKEAALSNLDNLPAHSEEVREFVSDVIAHQADIRFITMAAQKFIDESKEFVSIVNEQRASLESRSAPLSARGDQVRDAAGSARRRHGDLAARAQRLLDRLRSAHAALQRHRAALQRAQQWLQDLEPQVRSALEEGVGGEPRAVEAQLQRVKALHNEILSQGRLVDNAKEACEQLLNSLEGNITPSEARQLESPVHQLVSRVAELGAAVAERCADLEAALLHCQGLQDAAEAQANWLAQAENAFKNQQKPASLIRERLDEQVREQRLAHGEAEARRATLAKLLAGARDAARAPSNARIAKKLEQRAEDIYARYEKLVERSSKRGQFLEEVSSELARFTQQAAKLEAAHSQLLEMGDTRLHELCAARDKQMPLLEECLRNGKQLLAKKDVTDTHVVRDRIKALENQWRDFNTNLEEKQKLSKQKADHLNQYESLRIQVVEWLHTMEERVSRLQPVAVDLDIVKVQHEELRPLTKEYRDFSTNIDKVNEAGSLYENLTRGERADSPHRRRQIYSPTKRQTPTRSLDARSPSPSKGHMVSPGSHSASSGFSSRRSSQDGFHLEELSPVQQQLSDINNRYGLLGSKLSDRQAEIDSIRDEIRKHLDNFRTLNNFLDKVQRQLPKESVPNTKDEADKTIKQTRAVLEEMYEKQSLLDSTKSQIHELLKRKQSAQGADRLHDELQDLTSRWKSLHDAFKDKIRLMEEMKDFHDTYNNLSQWLSAKDRMMAALGPISSDSRMVQTQVQQVQVLREEFRGQQPQLSHLEQVGAAVLDRLEPDSTDASKLRQKVHELQDKWNRLLDQLEQRAASLGAAADTCRELDAGLARLRDALSAISDRLDAVPPHPADDRLRSIENLERQLEGQRPLLADLEAAGEALGAVLGEPAARQDVAHKLAGAARQYEALQRRLDMAKAEAEAALKEGRNLEESVSRTLGWLQTELGALPGRLRVSAARPTLQQQLDKHEPLYRQLNQREHEIIMLLDKVKGVSHDLSDLEKELDSMKAPGRDVKTVRQQLEDLGRFYKRLENADDLIADAERAAEGLVDSGHSVDVTKTRDQVEGLRKQLGKLDERARSKEQDLDDTLSKLEAFYKAYDAVMEDVQEATEQVRSLKPVSSEVEQIRSQQKDFADLKTKTLEPLGQNVAHCNKIGQGLVRSANQGVSTQTLEKDLEKMNDRWNALKEKMNERERRLDVGLLQSGKFAEALAGLEKWLSDTEDMVHNQKPPSADYKVVKAQLQEQKFLKKMLMDRQNSMSSLFAMGNEVAAGCEPAERKAVEKQLKALMQRFDALTDGAQQRMLDLEQAMKILHDDILSKQPAFKELTETASTLMGLVGDDEATALADRLQAAADRYQALVEHSLNIGELLDNSRKGLRHLVLTYQDLSAWMDGMEQYLAKRKILPVHMEKLLRQMDDLAEKTEEIASKQEAVDSTVESGLELMKHISGDEALQLKEKLDALQRRYIELSARGADLLRHASDTLPLVQQFTNSHAKLTEWMAGAETCLQSVEPLEEDILRLEAEIQEFRPVLENINLVGPQLCQVYFYYRNKTISDCRVRPPAATANALRAQLQAQRPLAEEVSAQRVRAKDLLAQAKKVLRECQSSEEAGVIRDRSEELREMMEEVGRLSAARIAALEQALPLAEHFADTHHGLSSWLDEMEDQIQMLAMPALRPEQIVQQQDKNEMLQQSISGHKPLVDKLVKTGEALSRLCGEEDAAKLQDIVEADCERYNALRAELRQRQQELEQALQESSQFSDKLEGMLRALAGTADQLHHAEPVSAHPPKIQDQIEENNALSEDLEKRQEAYNAVQRAASDVISKANKSDPAVRDIRNKLDKLNKLWDEVQKARNVRGESLESALDTARRFWQQLRAVMRTLGELEDALGAQPPPAAEPRAIQLQQVALQEIRHEIDHTKPEVEKVRKTGSTLMSICGEPDKPEVKKHMEDLDSAWDNITALYARREENLIDAMEKAMEFHDTLQNLLEFLDTAEEKFSNMGALGSDIDAVKRQIAQLATFKQEVDPHMVKVEALNRQAQELTERTSSEQAAAIKQPLTEVNARWSTLLRGMVDRQQQLERALLRLGQLQHALQELLAWIEHTSATLDTLQPVAGEPQILEVELAKLKVLVNDIAAHQASIDTLNDAGAHIVQHGSEEAGETAEKLSTLNRKWRALQQKARDRQTELEDALREAQSFNAEIGDLLSWLSEVDAVIAASKPVGGLPETATEQLERFMEVYNEIEANRPKMEAVLQQGQEYLKRQQKPSPTSQLHHNLKNLKSRWDNVTSRASDKKIKLEIALKEATEFHDALQSFVDWLTSRQTKMTNSAQIEEHKAFQKEVATHRETMLQLDKKGTHLKYFSQKQDVILIKNLLVSVQHRWERVVAKAAERTRALDHGFKEAKEFSDMWNNLMSWLSETEQQLDQLNSEANVNDPDKIKQR